MAKKKKGKSQDDSQSNEDNGSIKDTKHDSDISDSDDWNNKAGKTKKKKSPSKRSKRKMTKSSSEDSASEKEPAKQLSEPEEGTWKLNLLQMYTLFFLKYVSMIS